MELPPTDDQGRFLPQFRDGSILRRIFAKLLDALLTGVASWGFSLLMPLPVASLLAVLWFCLADWSGSPGKWFLRLRVVMLDGAPVTPLASLKRNVVLGLPVVARAVIVAGWTGLDATASQWDRVSVACIGLAVTLGELIGMVFQPMNRRWGDAFARTRVVDR